MERGLLAHSAPCKGRDAQAYGEHVRNVRFLASKHANGVDRYASQRSMWRSWRKSIPIAAEWHDLGKLDPDNQTALRAGRGARLPVEVDHIDAGVARALADEASDHAAAWLIRAHHAPGLRSAVTEAYRGEFYLRGRRDERDIDDIHRELLKRSNDTLSELIEQHKACVLDPLLPMASEVAHGLPARIALSCLVDADHSDTARFDAEGACEISNSGLAGRGSYGTDGAEPRWLDRLAQLKMHVAKKNQRSNQNRRNWQRQQLFAHMCEVPSADGIATCRAGVGLGKTTAVLAYLLRHAAEKGLRRLVIVAPFTNILTQTAKVLRDALVLEGEDAERIVLEHHHRAEFADPALRACSVLWDAPIVLTTAVQFFETLGDRTPSALRKLHRLPGSGIMIDESHAALPADIWPQAFEWLHSLAQEWTCPAVLTSGSLVEFWKEKWGRPPGANPIELAELSPGKILEAGADGEVERVALNEIEKPLDAASLRERIVDTLPEGGNALLILNTVLSAATLARDFAAYFKQLARDDVSLAAMRVLHLSTVLTPTHRERVLSEIHRRMASPSPFRWVLVATSCVEAGVDLDFDVGYREDASVASLIQTSGRVNRHGLKPPASLFRFQLQASEGVSHHPGMRRSAEILRRLFPEIQSHRHSWSALATAAMRQEIHASGSDSPGMTLCQKEQVGDYPKVVELSRVISNASDIVLTDRSLVARVRAGAPVGARELLRHSVQIWKGKAGALGLESVVPSHGEREGALYFASPASYDTHLLGLGRALIEMKPSISCAVL